MDVARCLAESNLVNGDLLPILSLCSENGKGNKHKSRVALACCGLLTLSASDVAVRLTFGSGIAGSPDLAD